MTKDYTSLLPLIEGALPKLTELHAILGFDATVDVICKPVETREGSGSAFEPFATLRDFGQRVVDADGKSALIEIVKELEKIGGNGPIMANALSQSGVDIDYIGPLGTSGLHPAYTDFAQRISVHSVAEPAVTHALEFSNGKLMLSTISNYEAVTATAIEGVIGKSALIDKVGQTRLCCFLNWTCLPELESIMAWFLKDLLPAVSKEAERIFFFDLADPSMRSDEDLRRVLRLIGKFEAFGQVVLGMNLNEAQQVARAFSIPEPSSDADSLCSALEAIRSELGIRYAMAHPVDLAACATEEGQWAVGGPHTSTPKITTGAGDHLNAGFCLGLMLGFSPADALKLGVLFSGYYVRTAISPRLEDIPEFIEQFTTTPV
ncbi:MAG: carbohydrate kinase family protein [Verrucomicrobiota bacterium]